MASTLRQGPLRWKRCRHAVLPGSNNTVTQCDDQALLRSTLSGNTSMIYVHTDWCMNYAPKTPGELNIWRVVHWSGTRKPWGGCGPYVCADLVYNDSELHSQLVGEWYKEWGRWRGRCV